MSLPEVGSGLPTVDDSTDDILTATDAASTYLTQANAATTYLAQADAATDYVAVTEPVLYAQRATLEYTDTTDKSLFTLPTGAQIVSFTINVIHAFNGDTTNHIDIGIDGDVSNYVANYSCGSAAIALAASRDETVLSAATPIVGRYTPGGGTPSAGDATITVQYIVPAE